MIGTPDPVSNLRPVKYYVPPNETAEEREWRLTQTKVDEFNQSFWSANNALFTQAKAEYERELQLRGEEVTAEAMSVFYKDFLDKAYGRQMEYNRQWWKMNIAMLKPGCKAAFRSLRSKKEEVTQGTGFWEKSFES
ncbi:hypothetical protein EC973_007661 [Apophysomyces ossiformis]|uniref:Apoptogenic protein 1, mitochondrial n=1 Tax=Apophysomyces ossiformis TaxID=679940 RepID=A0A8H7BLY9_9FUNG|nr:hypothetical protein EC973_007661 [Apophysomyces ossiformis]